MCIWTRPSRSLEECFAKESFWSSNSRSLLICGGTLLWMQNDSVTFCDINYNSVLKCDLHIICSPTCLFPHIVPSLLPLLISGLFSSSHQANQRKLVEHIVAGSVKKIEKLLEQGLDPNFVTEDGSELYRRLVRYLCYLYLFYHLYSPIFFPPPFHRHPTWFGVWSPQPCAVHHASAVWWSTYRLPWEGWPHAPAQSRHWRQFPGS